MGDRKCVGLAQRRTHGGAWFQCAALLRWDADELLAREEDVASDVEETAREDAPDGRSDEQGEVFRGEPVGARLGQEPDAAPLHAG